MSRNIALLIGALTLIAAPDLAGATPSPAPSSTSSPVPTRCAGEARSGAGTGSFDTSASQGCDDRSGDRPEPNGASDPAQPVVLYRQVDCGPPRVGVPAVVNHANFCNLVRRECNVVDPKELPTDPHMTTLALLRSDDGGKTWVYTGADCAARTAQPRVTPLLARQEIEKLVPRPEIGVAPPGGKTLVNLQTVLWADTPADRALGTVTLLGTYRVALRVHVQEVAWAFGDGATEVADGPGLPYRKGEHCTTVTCPGHFGHVYATTGTMTITEQVRSEERRVGKECRSRWSPYH